MNDGWGSHGTLFRAGLEIAPSSKPWSMSKPTRAKRKVANHLHVLRFSHAEHAKVTQPASHKKQLTPILGNCDPSWHLILTSPQRPTAPFERGPKP